MQKYQVGVAHNPTSNMKLASGAAPVDTLIDHGIAVGIGSDGEKENNNLDIFEEMKVASLLGKFRAMRADALPSWRVLRMATIDGARAIGMADRIGSLEQGKQADIIAVRGNVPHMTPFIAQGPFFNLHHNLVHAVQSDDVIMTMVDGHIVAENGVLLNGDMAQYHCRRRTHRGRCDRAPDRVAQGQRRRRTYAGVGHETSPMLRAGEVKMC